MATELPDLGYKPTVGEAIKRAAQRFGDVDFLVLPDRRMTFAQAEAWSRRLARQMLASGLGKGSRVGLFFTYGPEFVVAWLAALRIGALVMPFSTVSKPPELRRMLRMGDVAVLLAPARLLGIDVCRYLEEVVPGLSDQAGDRPLLVDELPYLRSIWMVGAASIPWARAISLVDPQVDQRTGPHVGADGAEATDALLAQVEEEVVPADLAQVTYTSGSSALPKGVVHSHGSIVRTTAHFGELVQSGSSGMTATPGARPASPGERRVFCAFPFFWIGGTLVLGGALHSGFTILCLERFEPEEALTMVERERATSVAAWPSFIQSMRNHPSRVGRDLSSCPMLTDGPSDVALVNSPVPGVPAHRGMSETVGNWYGVDRRVMDPITGADLPEGAEGELLVRGYGLMQGYYKKEREEVFDPDGWFHTGDRAFLHGDRPYFKGRYSETIKVRGANVSPREVELMLEGVPGVQHAIVMGLPRSTGSAGTAELDEEVTAVVVPAPGCALDPAALADRARAELSAYKVPTRWELFEAEDEVPWLGSGKPDKGKLRELLRRRHAGP